MPVSVVDSGDIEKTIRALQKMSPAARRAANRTIRKTTTFARNRSSSLLAASADVSVRNLRSGKGRRFFVRNPAKQGAVQEGSVWIGYNPVLASYVGAIPQWRRGLTPRVRSHRFRGDFVATMPSGKRSIFTRSVFPDKKRRKALGRREARPLSVNKWGVTSLPIDEQRVELREAEAIARQVESEIGPKLRGILAQELNYEFRVLRR
jgi:hypothetical protein